MTTKNTAEGRVSWKKQRGWVDLAPKIQEKTDKELAKTTDKRHELPPLPQARNLDFSFTAWDKKQERKNKHKYKPP
jgi:hypothetical protein